MTTLEAVLIGLVVAIFVKLIFVIFLCEDNKKRIQELEKDSKYRDDVLEKMKMRNLDLFQRVKAMEQRMDEHEGKVVTQNLCKYLHNGDERWCELHHTSGKDLYCCKCTPPDWSIGKCKDYTEASGWIKRESDTEFLMRKHQL